MNKTKNLLRYFGKIWKKKDDIDNLSNLIIEKLLKNDKEINVEGYAGYIDPANIMIIIPKKEGIKKLIENNFEVEQDEERTQGLINSLIYIPDTFRETSGTYTEEYTSIIFNLIKGCEEVKIKMREDSPLWVECVDMIIILAPRIEE